MQPFFCYILELKKFNSKAGKSSIVLSTKEIPGCNQLKNETNANKEPKSRSSNQLALYVFKDE